MSGLLLLIGYRGVGKTTIGRRVAVAMSRTFVDTDQEITRQKNGSVNEIVEREGWQGFRECEKEIIGSLKTLRDTVVATGGGAILHTDEWEELAACGTIVWLTADPEVIRRRITQSGPGDHQRPSLSGGDVGDEVRKILLEREPFYRKYAHFQIDTGEMEICEAVEKIQQLTSWRKEK